MSFFKPVFKTLNLIEISRKRILDNFDIVQKLNSEQKIWPVVKANAYGHGLNQIVSILNKRKFKYFVVDSYFEAIKIREISNKNILIIGSTDPINFKMMNFKNLALMVQDRESIESLGRLKKKVKIHLKINTGMNRQGFDLDELKEAAEILKKFPLIEVEGIFSHLADADNLNNVFTENQEKKFGKALDKILNLEIRPKYIHLSATSGLAKIKDSRINAVRLGIGLYGFGELKNLKPALQMISVFTKIREIDKGEKVGYNCTFTADKKTNIGIVPVGYYEAFDRRLSNCGWIKYRKKFFQIIGRVCMNLSMVNLKNEKANNFDEVEIISWNSEDKNSILNMAKICKTISYEILVKINETIRRKIV